VADAGTVLAGHCARRLSGGTPVGEKDPRSSWSVGQASSLPWPHRKDWICVGRCCPGTLTQMLHARAAEQAPAADQR